MDYKNPENKVQRVENAEKDRSPKNGNPVIAFDADDTLWHNENLFADIQDRLTQMVAKYIDLTNNHKYLDEELVKIERENLDIFGYGIKSFTLSMIETAIKITEGRITANDIQQLLEWGKEMLAHPIQLIDNAAEIVSTLSKTHRLGLITKGELFQQESRIARSGLVDYFDFIEILSHKTPDAYQIILEKYDIATSEFIMVGNSFQSDILPVLELGAQAIYIPYHITWELEQVPESVLEENEYLELKDISHLPELLESLES